MRWLYLVTTVTFFGVAPLVGGGSVAVALFSSSVSGDESGFGIHQAVLARLLLLAKEKNPVAVFFMGDMVLGGAKGDRGNEIPDVADVYGRRWGKEGYRYVSDIYQKRLEAFSLVINTTLGAKVPVYPVLGFQESLGRDSASLVKTHFGVRSQINPTASPLAYHVAIDNAFFLLFSTTRYDPTTQSIVRHDLNKGLLDWIEKTLQDNRSKYEYCFAVGSEPAFSTTESEGVYRGFDSDWDARNRLWRIFAENGVMAYFAASEHLYDRTNRSGIWQVISGGGGASLHEREFDKAFYHFLLLSIPKEKGELPRVQVYDAQGSLSDAFELIPRQYPVYQLRISDLAEETSEAKRKS